MAYLLALVNKFTVTTKHVMKSRHGSLSKGQMGMGVFSILVSPHVSSVLFEISVGLKEI